MFASSDTAAALDFDSIAAGIEHDLDNFRRRTNILFAGEKSCRSFDEICMRLDCTFASLFHFVDSQRVSFKNDFDFRAIFVTNIDNRRDICSDLVPFSTANPSIIRDDIEVLNLEIFAILFRLQNFRVSCGKSKWKIANDADSSFRAGSQFRGNRK